MFSINKTHADVFVSQAKCLKSVTKIMLHSAMYSQCLLRLPKVICLNYIGPWTLSYLIKVCTSFVGYVCCCWLIKCKREGKGHAHAQGQLETHTYEQFQCLDDLETSKERELVNQEVYWETVFQFFGDHLSNLGHDVSSGFLPLWHLLFPNWHEFL